MTTPSLPISDPSDIDPVNLGRPGNVAEGRYATADRSPGMVRSEERLHVDTALAAAGSVRLEKYLVTETRTMTVEVTSERVRLVRTGPDGQETVEDNPSPSTPSTADAGAAPDESSGWLVLYEERVSVTKEQVPVERVRLDTYLITEQREITESVRSERIELTTDPGMATERDKRA